MYQLEEYLNLEIQMAWVGIPVWSITFLPSHYIWCFDQPLELTDKLLPNVYTLDADLLKWKSFRWKDAVHVEGGGVLSSKPNIVSHYFFHPLTVDSVFWFGAKLKSF